MLRPISDDDDSTRTRTRRGEKRPASVGKPDYSPGDPNGLEIIDEGGAGEVATVTVACVTVGRVAGRWSLPVLPGKAEELVDTVVGGVGLERVGVARRCRCYTVGASPNLPDEWIDNPGP